MPKNIEVTVRPMDPADLPDAISLWSATEGVSLSVGDSPEELTDYLRRNPGISHVAIANGGLVGAALAGHDGRRGFMYHVAVSREWQGKGIGREIVDSCAERLRAAGVKRVYVFVLADNVLGRRFWEKHGWIPFKEAEAMRLVL